MVPPSVSLIHDVNGLVHLDPHIGQRDDSSRTGT